MNMERSSQDAYRAYHRKQAEVARAAFPNLNADGALEQWVNTGMAVTFEQYAHNHRDEIATLSPAEILEDLRKLH